MFKNILICLLLVLNLNQVHEEDYILAIKDYLNYEQVSFDNQTLKIVVGDGNGKVLRGKLKTNYCRIEKEELETHFFFKKIWQKATS